MGRKSITGLDIETTGLDPAAHRIIEIAALRYDADTGEFIDKLVRRVNPERSIDPEAQNVHGIALEDLAGEPTWSAIAGEVLDFLCLSDTVVIHNAQFDGPFVAEEMTRAGLVMPAGIEVFCTMENGRWACFDGKQPKLQELCFALGVPYDEAAAHAAEYDVAQMMDCFFRGLKRGFFKL